MNFGSWQTIHQHFKCLHELRIQFAGYKKAYLETHFQSDAKKELMGLFDKTDEPDILWPKLLDRFYKKI